MVSTDDFSVPDDLELLEFFGSAPTLRDDGLHVYEMRGSQGVVLRFSFDVFERSIQTRLSVNDEVQSVVCQENALRMWIDKAGLHADFVPSTTRTRLLIVSVPNLQVQWSTLVIDS